MSVVSAVSSSRRTRRALVWIGRFLQSRIFAAALVVAALLSGAATYVALTKAPPIEANADTVYYLLNIDLALLLILSGILVRRIVTMWAARKRRQAGAQLHARLVAVFSMLAVVPAIVVTGFSLVFFHIGVQAWFGEKVRSAIDESYAVAQAYKLEHQQALRADALAMASDLNQAHPSNFRDKEVMDTLLTQLADLRGLPEAIIVNERGEVLAEARFSFALGFEILQSSQFAAARRGDVLLFMNREGDRVRALMSLRQPENAFLFVGRAVDKKVLEYVESTEGAVQAYNDLDKMRSSLQITFTLIFLVVTLLLLVAAVWMGLAFATRLVRPIGELVGAAERVRAGDLTARVAESGPEDELALLSRAFNRMTNQLDTQRQELIEANRLLDNRRRFMEAVLGGVSAGVIGMDAEGCIHLPNRSAAELLGTELEDIVGAKLVEVVPEMEELFELARRRGRLTEGQIRLQAGTVSRNLLVRVAPEKVGDEIRGFVLTFDDVTELMSAQRKAAWADVARRIAHEIKNPLTPIQLSAERLKRKYLKEIRTDPEIFTACTDTIVRQVGDIGRMVDEFSAFARMPSPVIKPEDLNTLVRQAVVLQENAHGTVTFTTNVPAAPVVVPCDGRQVAQALTNLLQNALDAIQGRLEQEPDGEPGLVEASVTVDGSMATITVADNGKGLPAEDRNRLTEPYVTTRAKGTGLGLAIVKKIMEDHGGDLTLEDRPGGGAMVRLAFPLAGAAPHADETTADKKKEPGA